MKKYKTNDIINCRVSGIETYGIFVVVDRKYTGLIHISEVSNEFVRDINDYVKIGENIFAKIISIDESSKQMKLSIKDIDFANTGLERDEIDSSEEFKSLKENLPIWMKEKLEEFREK